MERKKNSSPATRKGMSDYKQHPASFRDPAGFVFEYEGKFYRQVNQYYAADFELFKKSGLYTLLLKEKKILSHAELDENLTGHPHWYKTLLPDQLPFISYPYEWCFSQWKDAALLTLDLVKTGIEHGMILKDATPFNIQFVNGDPVFIDSLSFEKYDSSKPWVAYRQFMECFMAPLLLAKYNSPDLLKIFRLYPQGLSLSVLITMLPFKARLNMNVLLHIFLPASIKGGRTGAEKKEIEFTKQKLLHIIHNLESFVQSIHLPLSQTSWNNYYEETVLSNAYVNEKKQIVSTWIKDLPVTTVLDLGTNTGLFAQITAAAGKFTIAVDADISCIDKLYNNCRQKKIANILPLYTDILNPAPAVGWSNKERDAFLVRAKPSLTMALALIHHLAISNNVDFSQIAELFGSLSPWLIIEFVPKTDPKVQQLLANRQDVFTGYTQENFEAVFADYFDTIYKASITGTLRTLYCMKKKTTTPA